MSNRLFVSNLGEAATQLRLPKRRCKTCMAGFIAIE
jgi:hypothetical protein